MADSAPPTLPAIFRNPTHRRKPLPAEFLALPSVGGPTDLVTSTSAQQMDADEAIARMFQDEQFIEQVRADPELGEFLRAQERAAARRRAREGRGGGGGGGGGSESSSPFGVRLGDVLDRRGAPRSTATSGAGMSSSSGGSGSASGSGPSWSSSFASGLASMGTSMRRRLAGLAAGFSGGSGSSGSGAGGGGGRGLAGAGGASDGASVVPVTRQASSAAAERRGLLEADEDEEGNTTVDLDVLGSEPAATSSVRRAEPVSSAGTSTGTAPATAARRSVLGPSTYEPLV